MKSIERDATTWRVKDEQIKKDLIDRLYWDSRIDSAQAKVSVADGLVELTGAVDTVLAREVAEETAWTVPGTMAVVNHLEIRLPKGHARPGDAELAARIEAELEAVEGLRSPPVEIQVDDGKVLLLGSVGSLPAKREAERLALHVRGVRSVSSRLAVTPAERPADLAIAKQVTAAVDLLLGAAAARIEVEVEAGQVTLMGNIPSRADLIAVQGAAEEVEGVRKVRPLLAIR